MNSMLQIKFFLDDLSIHNNLKISVVQVHNIFHSVYAQIALVPHIILSHLLRITYKLFQRFNSFFDHILLLFFFGCDVDMVLNFLLQFSRTFGYVERLCV